MENNEELIQKVEILNGNLKEAKKDRFGSKIEYIILQCVLLVLFAFAIGCCTLPVLLSPEIGGLLISAIATTGFATYSILAKPWKYFTELKEEYMETHQTEDDRINHIMAEINQTEKLILDRTTQCTLPESKVETFTDLEKQTESVLMEEPTYSENYNLDMNNSRIPNISRTRRKNKK